MKNHIGTVSISHEAAVGAVSAALKAGAAISVPVSVTVVDPALGLVAYVRADGTPPHSIETSRRKANTAASTRRPSGWMQGDFAVALPLGTGNLLTNIRGGVPISFGGIFVGGLGIAGGTPDQDIEIATAVLAAIGADSPTP
jgi:glc operon protein GlcG|tara:strand:+ start:136 stop:561 length:426 start_codon:yes stop_codon:yes gene_type:complete